MNILIHVNERILIEQVRKLKYIRRNQNKIFNVGKNK